ncbi:uncharacterized protein LOC103869782 [Brassica rapa]|uniref:uncharacterized protein LOC103869782 n=1 Tax=Brassica campestris TaxID=3711 RepID=UPI0004F1994E|nr:uncharacterized protein LOC103869782 [Brassica rapa]
MSAAMDKAMLELSLQEEDEPFQMPDLPQFDSSERNSRSLIGRILNLDCQKVSTVILDMPRQWQKQGKVRGVALSRERFQFIFDHEHDLLEVLEKGVHTSNDWALAIDRWVEHPPPDYLQYMLVWVRIRNIPVNHYTKEAITALGELAGEVKIVAFDPDKPQREDYVRVQVRLNVSRPLRTSKVVNLPQGGSAVVLYNYERIRKRCYECQSLNHEKEVCPIIVGRRRNQSIERRQKVLDDKESAQLVLKQGDPLFGVLSEDQVGFCKFKGRWKISLEVLDEMRRYLLSSSDEDKLVRIERVRAPVAETEKNPITQKTMLRLEEPPVFTKQLDKGKGIVFDFDLNSPGEVVQKEGEPIQKLMASALDAGRKGSAFERLRDLRLTVDEGMRSKVGAPMNYASASFFSEDIGNVVCPSRVEGNSTEYGPSHSMVRPSGVLQQLPKRRRRPYIKKRQEQKGNSPEVLKDLYGDSARGDLIGGKRKTLVEDDRGWKAAKLKESRVIPSEGSPKPR